MEQQRHDASGNTDIWHIHRAHLVILWPLKKTGSRLE